jgi:transcription initiation factor TFIIIB Brf1 subunit/transcription initiation factor TFIIB
MPEYDRWFKEVIKGKMNCFYPRRISLLEIPGTILLLYHSHRRKIVGEAKIVKSTLEDNIHRYWFDKFIVYPNPVELKSLHSDPRLKLVAERGRWRLVYLTEETLEEIRKLSGLPEVSLERLRGELVSAKREAGMRIYLRACARHKDKMARVTREARKLSTLGVDTEVLKKAEEILSKADKKGLLRGRSVELLFFASLYIAFRALGIPKSLREVQQIGNLDRKKLASLTRLLLRELEIKFPPISLRDWLLHYSDKLDMTNETIQIADNLLDKIKAQVPVSGLSPLSVSATVAYLACQETREKISQKKIAEIFGVSAVTIRNLSKRWLTAKVFENAK